MFQRLNRLWCLGRDSTVAYLRFYPNPGFMIPWFGGRRLRWSWHHGLTITKGMCGEMAQFARPGAHHAHGDGSGGEE